MHIYWLSVVTYVPSSIQWLSETLYILTNNIAVFVNKTFRWNYLKKN